MAAAALGAATAAQAGAGLQRGWAPAPTSTPAAGDATRGRRCALCGAGGCRAVARPGVNQLLEACRARCVLCMSVGAVPGC